MRDSAPWDSIRSIQKKIQSEKMADFFKFDWETFRLQQFLQKLLSKTREYENHIER